MARFTHVVALSARLRLPAPVLESFGAGELVTALNEHWRAVADIVSKHGGSASAFSGEELTAWFSRPDEARAAALSLLKHEGEFAQRATFGIMDGHVLEARLGVSDIVAPMVLGEAVRVASQLAIAGGRFGAQFVTGVPLTGLPSRVLDLIRVRGTSAPLEIAELVTAEPAHFQPFRLGYTHYLAQEWSAAEEAFERCGDDRAAWLYLSRIAALQATPPGESWDGVFPVPDLAH